MTDNDLYPCPHCRGERVVCIGNEWMKDMFWVECFSCEAKGPRANTADRARQVYNVVAKLVDDVMNAYAQPKIDATFNRARIVNALAEGVVAFFQARREHPPY